MENQVNTKTSEKLPTAEEIYKFMDRLSDEERDAFIDSLPDDQVEKFARISVARRQKKVLNTQHPAISDEDRFTLKNIGDMSVANVQRMFPQLDVSVDDLPGGTGSVIVRDPSEGSWQRIDPEGSGDLPEFSRDVKDLTYDIPSVMASWYGPLAGATTGAVALSPLGPLGTAAGAIGGGFAGGAATEAGLETLKQGLGKYFGARGEMDTGEIGDAAKRGALFSLLGVGRPTKAMKVSLAKKGLDEDAVVQPFRKLFQKSVSGVQSGISGTPMADIELLKKYFPELKQVEKSAVKDGAIDPIADLHVKLSGDVRNNIDTLQAKNRAGTNDLFPIIDKKAGGVNIASVKNNVDNLIMELESKKFLSPLEEERLARLKTTRDNYFFHDVEVIDPPEMFTTDVIGNKVAIQKPGPGTKRIERQPIPNVVPAERAQAIRSSFYSDAAAQQRDKTGKSTADKLEDAELKKLGGLTAGQMQQAADVAGIGQEYAALNTQFKKIKGKDKYLTKAGIAYKEPDDMVIKSGIKKANGTDYAATRKTLEALEREALGSGIIPAPNTNQLDLLRTALQWMNPSVLEKSQHGMTATAKTNRRLYSGIVGGGSFGYQQADDDNKLGGFLTGASLGMAGTSLLGSNKGIRTTHALARPFRKLGSNTGTIGRRGVEDYLMNKYLNPSEDEE